MSTFHHHHQHHNKHQNSTADRFYDLDQSQRRYQELVQQNIWLKQQITRSRMQEDTCNQCHICPDCSNTVQHERGQSDQVLWGMLQRNKYLQQKIQKLRGQYEKQSRTISAIRSSDKWKTRMICNQGSNSCYEDKYLQILRIRSPFY